MYTVRTCASNFVVGDKIVQVFLYRCHHVSCYKWYNLYTVSIFHGLVFKIVRPIEKRLFFNRNRNHCDKKMREHLKSLNLSTSRHNESVESSCTGSRFIEAYTAPQSA